MPVPAIFYAHRCELPVKSINPVGRFYHMMKCHIAAIGEKNRQVRPDQSVAKIACDLRWRSNSPRSATFAKFLFFDKIKVNNLNFHFLETIIIIENLILKFFTQLPFSQ